MSIDNEIIQSLETLDNIEIRKFRYLNNAKKFK